MKIERVRVKHYRSIIDTGWVELEQDITTLLGKNESGKSSFLQAIASVSTNESYEDMELHVGSERRSDEPFPVVTLEVAPTTESDQEVFDQAGLDEFVKVVKYSDGSRSIEDSDGRITLSIDQIATRTSNLAEKTWQDLNNIRNSISGNYRNHFDNQLKNPLNNLRNDNNDRDNTKFYANNVSNIITSLEKIPEQNKEIEEKKEEYIDKFKNIDDEIQDSRNSKEVVSNYLPSIVYHDEFDTISDSVSLGALDQEEYRTFRNLLKLAGVDYNEFKQLDQFQHQRMLDTAETNVAGQVNSFWQQKNVEVDIDFSDNTFSVQIKDTSLANSSEVTTTTEGRLARTLVRPSSRSKGFQWFLSFYINLAAETGEENKNKIILLDDPAVFLHPEGKKNWLDAIEEMAEDSQIVFSSHSPFLIRKEFPERLRVVEDRPSDGTIITNDLSESDSMTLEPLRNALGIGLGDSPFVSKRKILVEGVTDYYILTGLANFFKDTLESDILRWDEVTIMPTNGGNNMINAAKWVSSENFSYVLLLDNDSKGREVTNQIESQHQEIDLDRVILLQLDDEGQNYHIEIEDVFDTEFFINCANIAYEREFDEFTPITYEQTEDSCTLDGIEYKNRKITSKLDDALKQQGMGDFNKVLVANEIRDRLTAGEVAESDVKNFKPILGRIRSLT